MVSRKIRRSVLALALAASFGLLPPLAAQSRLPRATAARETGSASAPWVPTWRLPLPLRHVLTTLLGKSGAKIDGNG